MTKFVMNNDYITWNCSDGVIYSSDTKPTGGTKIVLRTFGFERVV